MRQLFLDADMASFMNHAIPPSAMTMSDMNDHYLTGSFDSLRGEWISW
ncbi:hypothetical protein [Nocardiopsis metallicus]|uniref:Uncharacterized protein n=1 Tax=Nocardiopsis metallicus TaxID=179819 RepID=A0A840W3G5_9ACTN|nr:hypothetical protein [Nocardiopsis metallicus]MBB5491409.1 hypothetical protein [Nocardiopsis metallicus]